MTNYPNTLRWVLRSGLLALSMALIFSIQACDQLNDFLNPGGPPESATFHVRIENISHPFPFLDSGVFNTPEGAAEPGPAFPGTAYAFSFKAAPGYRLSFATMFVQSNDLFYAPGDEGLELFDGSGAPITGDVTSQVMLWDAGTEVNEEPGVGPHQAPRQSGPNMGLDENGVVQPVNDGFDYPAVTDVLRVTLDGGAEGQFTLRIENISPDDRVILAPGVFVVHSEPGPLFTSGMPDDGKGLEDLAEDGNPARLAAMLAEQTGVNTILAPGVWAVHGTHELLFSPGQPDRGEGLEALAEDGNPAILASTIADHPMVMASGVFDTPVGAAGPGPALPGEAYEFHFMAVPGARLSFATMFVQSNDLFYAPADGEIELFDANGMPRFGDVTAWVALWDAGTEVNELPGVGPNQAPRQAGPNTGLDEGGVVHPVSDDSGYPRVMDAIRVTIRVEAGP